MKTMSVLFYEKKESCKEKEGLARNCAMNQFMIYEKILIQNIIIYIIYE